MLFSALAIIHLADSDLIASWLRHAWSETKKGSEGRSIVSFCKIPGTGHPAVGASSSPSSFFPNST